MAVAFVCRTVPSLARAQRRPMRRCLCAPGALGWDAGALAKAAPCVSPCDCSGEPVNLQASMLKIWLVWAHVVEASWSTASLRAPCAACQQKNGRPCCCC